jgi:hypothetical protein
VSADAVVIGDVAFSPGSKKGDGFSCEILAVDFDTTVDGRKLSKRYIAKVAPDGPRAEMLKGVIVQAPFAIFFSVRPGLPDLSWRNIPKLETCKNVAKIVFV